MKIQGDKKLQCYREEKTVMSSALLQPFLLRLSEIEVPGGGMAGGRGGGGGRENCREGKMKAGKERKRKGES